MLSPLLQLVDRASELILGFYGRDDLEVEDKKDGSPITQADKASHELFKAELPKILDVPLISEEGAHEPFEVRQQWRKAWLLDPIDGTKDFINRTDDFCISLALIEDGAPVLGVVAAPALRSVWYAERGKGAFFRDASKAPVRIENTRKDEPLVGVRSRFHNSDLIMGFLDKHGVKETLARGSAIKYCMVAEGRADVYPGLGRAWEWDVAAGQLVVEEAGAVIADVDGAPLRYNKESLASPRFIARSRRFEILPKDTWYTE